MDTPLVFPKRVRNKELLKEMKQERPVIERCYNQARSIEDFFERIAEAGLDRSKYPLDPKTGRYSFDIDLARLTPVEQA